ncbi:ParA family protein [Azospirillum halopraeferens]|uniref:ParA family protein n=1 Tax=Azospirillum halopraeferens TaxID=34010 RepID=UPI0004148134|nr:AAA family ATPase [Azospirillum halopraeferens]
MTGDEMRALRERKAMNQVEFAGWINALLNRKYDGSKISRWETEREKIPREIEGTLLMAALDDGRTRPESRRPLVLALSLQKGGTSKTSSAVCIAYILARAGYRTLLIDADSQANASVHVGVGKDRIMALARAGRTLADALLGRAAAQDLIVDTTVPGLDLLPSSIALARADNELNGLGLSRYEQMATMIRSLAGRYDFVVIDCAPAVGAVTLNALVAADYVLLPCQTESFAVMALEDLVNETINAVRKKENPRLKVLGIVPTLYNARLSQDRASYDEIRALWGSRFTIYEPVPRSTVYAQASAAQTITLAGDPGAPGVETYVAIARDLIAAAHRPETADAA